jgi:hypothetical protein
MSDPFAPLNGGGGNQPPTPPARVPVAPIPADAPACPTAHPRLGSPSMHWLYKDEQGRPLCVIMRFDTLKGKEFRPLTYCVLTAKGTHSWEWMNFETGRPMYGLDRLGTADPAAVVIVAEGEKSADAAHKLLPGFVCMTSPGGSNGATKTNWSPVRGRKIVIWPDADAPGKKYAAAVQKLCKVAGAASIDVLTPPDGVIDGWDAANALEEGWKPEQAARLVEAAMRSRAPAGESETEKAEPKRVRGPDALIGLAQYFQFWVSTDGTRYARVSGDGASKNLPVNSEEFKETLTLKAFEATGQIPAASAIDQAVRYFSARAGIYGTKRKAWMRTGCVPGKAYISLGDDKGRAIEITPNDVRVISGEGLPFVASQLMQQLCAPDTESSSSQTPIDELRSFLNVESDDDFIVVVAWLVMALCGRGPYPILITKAEHGSGKTGFAERLGSLIDPCVPKAFLLPEKVRDLVVTAQNRFGLIIDNVSYISTEMSDALCVMAYGQGIGYRKLHTDSGMNVFADARPTLINSINDVAWRHDLSSRGLFVRLRPLPDADRRPDDELEVEWEAAKPRILGALCWAVSAGLRNLGKASGAGIGRFALLEKFMAAAEPGLGWAPGTFAAAYARNSAAAADNSFENDLVACAVHDMMVKQQLECWEGSPSKLLDKLDAVVSEKIRHSREWPKNPVSLGKSHDRCKKILRTKGIEWRSTKSGTRSYTISRIGGVPEE